MGASFPPPSRTLREQLGGGMPGQTLQQDGPRLFAVILQPGLVQYKRRRAMNSGIYFMFDLNKQHEPELSMCSAKEVR